MRPPEPPVRLTTSVVIATRNRPDHLRVALEALTRQTCLPDEVLIVDNASTVSYAHVFDEFRDRLPLRVVVEQTPGVSPARNRGMKESAGDIILFTDDDCEPEPQWVERLTLPFYRDPNIGVVGGPLINRQNPGGLIERFFLSQRD